MTASTAGASAGDELVNYLAANGGVLFQNPALLTANSKIKLKVVAEAWQLPAPEAHQQRTAA